MINVNMLSMWLISYFTVAHQHANSRKTLLLLIFKHQLSNLFMWTLASKYVVNSRKLLAIDSLKSLKHDILLEALKNRSLFSPLSEKTGSVDAEICFGFFFFRACEYDRSHHHRRCLCVSYSGAPPFSAHCHHPTSGLCEKSLQSSADQMPEWRRNTNSLHSLFQGILAKLCSASTLQKYRQ